MGLFKQIEGESAVLYERGVFKQTDLFSRDGFLYAKAAGGFVRLYADGSTSRAHVKIDTLAFGGVLFRDKLGRLCDASVAGASALAQPEAVKLLGAPDA